MTLSKPKPGRKITCKLLTMMDTGELDPLSVAQACLNYMSEYDVDVMAHSEGLLEQEDEDEDDEDEEDGE